MSSLKDERSGLNSPGEPVRSCRLDIEEGLPEDKAPRVEPGALALVEILARIEAEPYHWPVGRVLFQKIAYFATVVGIPTSLRYEANSYGPFAPSLSRISAQLQNNGLVAEVRRGQMFETRVGQTYESAKKFYGSDIERWEQQIVRVVDLVARFDSRRAEIAGSVHYVATVLTGRFGRKLTASEVISHVEKWKIKRKPAIDRQDIARSLIELAAMGWIDVDADDSVSSSLAELGV